LHGLTEIACGADPGVKGFVLDGSRGQQSTPR